MALVAATQAAELFFLFVVLPFVVAAAVIGFVSWRWRGSPAVVRTSEVLATGEAGQAEILSVKPMGGFLDARPMVRFGLRVRTADGAPFEIEVTQSIPRALLRGVRTGDTVDVRVTADHAAAAIVIGPPEPPAG